MDTTLNSLIEESEKLKRTLDERLEVHDNSRRAAQDKLHEICEGLRKQIDEFENKINNELEGNFNKEDSRLQNALSNLRDVDMDKLNDNNMNIFQQAIQKAKAELIVMQSYDIIECEHKNKTTGLPNNEDYEEPAMKKAKIEIIQVPLFGFTKMWNLKVDKKFVPETLYLKKPKDIHFISNTNGKISIQFTHLNSDEKKILSEYNLMDQIEYKCLLSKKESDANDIQNCKEYTLNETDDYFTFAPVILETETTYEINVKAMVCGKESEWSDEIAEFTTPEFKECCVWKKCPDNVEDRRKYSVDKNNPRIATMTSPGCCTIIGNAPIPFNKITSWSIKILKSEENDGKDIYIGVAPFDINQNEDNYRKCGWYFDCYKSTLNSGPPHKYREKEYGPRREKGVYVHIGDSIGVVIDTTKGELSFVLSGINCGIAYEGIPLDKPLVPCVILENNSGSVEIDPSSEVKENVDNSIPVPSNITTKSNTWDSITLTWNAIEGTSFYQIEVDGNESWATTTNYFTKRGFFPETEHSFRVRAVKNNAVSEWSDAVKGRTTKESFESGWWKECPDDVKESIKYSVDENNPRISSMTGNYYCTIIGNASLSPNKMTLWGIKILKSKKSNGRGIYIGVAPFDINQNEDNYEKCGWYFCCYKSTLISGPPHNYEHKKYGPRKGDGKYVQIGDSVGVVVDTTKGDLSFVMSNVDYGVAYEGIPLDKPLVPCVLLNYEGDSVELVI